MATIQSVERAFTLLEALAEACGEARLAELAARTGLDKGTMHGLLSTMASMGYITRNNKHYALGLRLRELTQPLTDIDTRLRETFAPALRVLAAHSKETCYLAVPCGSRDYLYIDALECERNLRVVNPRGRREGLLTSAIGHLFLAFDSELLRIVRRYCQLPAGLEQELECIAHFGFAIDLEQAEPGMNCLALPLWQHGRIVAAMGFAGPAQRLPKSVLQRMATEVMHDLFDITKK